MNVRVPAPLAAALLAAVGCSPAPTAEVTGTVTVGGKPVPEGRIAFYPHNGRAAVGTIGRDGRYTLTTFADGDGALLGPHKVTIDARRVTMAAAAPEPKSLEEELAGKGKLLGGPRPVVEWLVPAKYAEPGSTTLTADVKPGRNTIDFEIPARR
jgi:hypothetical protein